MECGGAVRRRDRPIDNEIVELERGWTVRVFDRPFLVAAFAAHSVRYFVAAGMFQKNGWCECWCTRALHAERNWWGRLRCPAVIIHQKWSGQSRAVGGASSWTAVELGGQLTFLSAHCFSRADNWESSRQSWRKSWISCSRDQDNT